MNNYLEFGFLVGSVFGSCAAWVMFQFVSQLINAPRPSDSCAEEELNMSQRRKTSALDIAAGLTLLAAGTTLLFLTLNFRAQKYKLDSVTRALDSLRGAMPDEGDNGGSTAAGMRIAYDAVSHAMGQAGFEEKESMIETEHGGAK